MKTHAALIALSALALTGCTATAEPSPVPTLAEADVAPVDPAVDPALDLDLGAIAPDVLLVIKANATASDGSVMKLELRVRTPVPFDDIGGYTVPTAAIASCPDLLNATVVAQNLWTFTRVNVLAVSEGGSTWPADETIVLLPSTQFAPIASMSFLGESPGGTQQCQQDKFVPGQGKGAISIGTANDLADPSAGGYHRWAQLDYGFVTTGTDVVLSACTFELTEAGSSLGGGVAWKSVADPQNCVTGAQSPSSQY